MIEIRIPNKVKKRIIARIMILAAQMVTTVFHQYEVGMREACIESKASQYFKGVAGLVSRVEHKSDEAG